RADALPRVAPPELREPDAGVAGERRDRIGEHLPDVRPCVDRPLGAELTVGDPALDHQQFPLTRPAPPRRPRRVVPTVRTSEGNCETAAVPDTANPPAD